MPNSPDNSASHYNAVIARLRSLMSNKSCKCDSHGHGTHSGSNRVHSGNFLEGGVAAQYCWACLASHAFCVPTSESVHSNTLIVL